MGIPYTNTVHSLLVWTMSIDKVNNGERFVSYFQAKFKLRRENFEPDMAWYNVL